MTHVESDSLAVGPGLDSEAVASSFRKAICHAWTFRSSSLIHSFRISSSNWSLMDLQRSKLPQFRLWASLNILVNESRYWRNWVFAFERICNGGGKCGLSSSDGLQKMRSSMRISWSKPDRNIDRQASKELAIVSSWEVTPTDMSLLLPAHGTGDEVAASWGASLLAWCVSGSRDTPFFR